MAPAPFPVPDRQEAFDVWTMCADAFKKSSQWLLCLNHWIRHTKQTWEPTVHTRRFHILVIMKDSSVSQSTGSLSNANRRTIP